MKKNLMLFMFIASAFIALNSCKKEYIVEVNGIVQGTVFDDANNPLKGATVALDGGTSKTTTDSLGYYKISGIAPGQHFVVASKAGFSTLRTSFYINTPDEVANTTSGSKQSFDYYAVVNPSLLALGGQLKGYVNFNDYGLANAKVTAYLDASYEPNVYTTTTNDLGVYTFSNLPVRATMTIVAIHPSEPSTQGSFTLYTNGSGRVSADGVLWVENIDVNTEPLTFVKGDYFKFENGTLVNDAVDTTANIVLTFSDNVSQVITQNEGGFIGLYDYLTENEVGATITYSGNKITIDPANHLTHGARYYVTFKVYSSLTKYCYNYSTNMTYSFYTKPAGIATLSGTPTISIVSNALHLVTAAVNAKGYAIYASKDGKAEFQRIVDSYTSFPTDYNISSYAAGSQFYIVPFTWDANDITVIGNASNIVTKP